MVVALVSLMLFVTLLGKKFLYDMSTLKLSSPYHHRFCDIIGIHKTVKTITVIPMFKSVGKPN